MATNFYEKGDTVEVAATADVLSGGIVVAGNLAGTAVNDALIGETVVVNLTGVWNLPNATVPLAFTQGADVYWDGTDIAVSGSGNVLLGQAQQAITADAALPAYVRLSNPVSTVA